MELLAYLSDCFFNEKFWLPVNTTWDSLKVNPDDDIYIAQPADLLYIFPAAIALFITRKVFEIGIATPLGRYYGISEGKVFATSNLALQRVYKENQYPDYKYVQGLSKQTDLSEKQIQRWFRRRRNQDRSTGMTKFTETSWRWFYYTFMFFYGVAVISQESWFWDVKDCFRGHPKQHVKPVIYWYYITELGFYVSLLFSQFVDVKRKDFLEQCIHHIATILLMGGSWIGNYVRMGALILCLHDAADLLLEAAKLARYMEKRTLCDVLFGLFTLCWAFTRLMVFPYVILWSCFFDTATIAGSTPALHVMNVLLWVLQVLHVIWFITIMTVLIRALQSGKVDKDVRSASEESCDETTPTSPNGLANSSLTT